MRKLYTLLITSLVVASFSLSAEVVDIDPDRLEQLVTEQDAVVVDVRTASEWRETGVIQSSKTLTFFDENGQYDAQQWFARLQGLKDPDQPVILVCRSGGRSAKVAEFLDREAGLKNVYNLEDGISGWIEQGKATKVCESASC